MSAYRSKDRITLRFPLTELGLAQKVASLCWRDLLPRRLAGLRCALHVSPCYCSSLA